jgi:hypothetical protein
MNLKETGWVWAGLVWLLPAVDLYEDDNETSDYVKYERIFGLCKELLLNEDSAAWSCVDHHVVVVVVAAVAAAAPMMMMMMMM